MNILMNKALISVAALAISTLAACHAPVTGAGEEAPLAGARIGGPFALTDQNGQTRRWDDYKGRYRLVYFGYTYCPDVCPTDLQEIMAGYALFARKAPARAARLQPIFISVDPERDTPAVLKNYVSAFSPKLAGLTGTSGQIAKVAKDFAVIYAKEGDQSATKDYLVSHSRTPFLFGPDGHPIALVPVDNPDTPEKEGQRHDVFALLDHWVQ